MGRNDDNGIKVRKDKNEHGLIFLHLFPRPAKRSRRSFPVILYETGLVARSANAPASSWLRPRTRIAFLIRLTGKNGKEDNGRDGAAGRNENYCSASIMRVISNATSSAAAPC